MTERFIALLAGLLFGLGLTLSGMIDPARVLGFLDLAGRWNPSLAVVMAAAVAVAAAGFAAARGRRRPLAAVAFHPPVKTAIDARLVVGALLFGVGWGLVGYCPGPALASLLLGRWQSWVFVAAMLLGMAAVWLIERPRRRARAA